MVAYGRLSVSRHGGWTHRPGPARGQGRVAAAAGLGGGLLVAGDDVLLLAQGFADEGTGPGADEAGPQIGPGITADWPETMASLAELALR